MIALRKRTVLSLWPFHWSEGAVPRLVPFGPVLLVAKQKEADGGFPRPGCGIGLHKHATPLPSSQRRTRPARRSVMGAGIGTE